MRFEFLEHTADAKFKAYGESIEDAFISSACAMFYILKGDLQIERNIRRKISLQASTYINLLHDFLEEFIFLIDTESLVLSEIESLEIDEERLSLRCVAHFDKASGYDISGDIKSVTYSEMEIKEEKGKFTTQVVVDI
ncbi:MAG: archease [Candidatus Woesearchaeota archaeon]